MLHTALAFQPSDISYQPAVSCGRQLSSGGGTWPLWHRQCTGPACVAAHTLCELVCISSQSGPTLALMGAGETRPVNLQGSGRTQRSWWAEASAADLCWTGIWDILGRVLLG